MENISFTSTEKTPEVNFDFNSGKFLIRGISIPENTVNFYQGLILALKDYAKNPKAETEFKFAYEYFNTSTSAIILKLIYAVEEIKNSDVKISWFYENDDFEMEEVGEDFKQMTSAKFELVAVEDLYKF